MTTVQSVLGGVQTGTPGPAVDIATNLLAKASTRPGGLDVSALRVEVDSLAKQNPALAAQVRDIILPTLSVTQRAEFERPARALSLAAGSRMLGLALTQDAYLASAKQLWSQVRGNPLAGFGNDLAVKAAERIVTALPTPKGDVIADPATRGFVVSVARATAEARIAGRDQDFEKFVVIGRGTDGQLVVKSLGLVGVQGGSIKSEPGDTVVHVHYRGLEQPPHRADNSAAKNGRPSFVVGSDGRTVWEVGKFGDKVQVRTVGDNGRVGAWQDYQTDPSRYRGY